MKKLLLFLILLIPFIGVGQDEPKTMGLKNIDFCGVDRIPSPPGFNSFISSSSSSLYGPYDPLAGAQPKIIPVIFRGVSTLAGSPGGGVDFDNYEQCRSICDTLLLYLNLYYNGGMDGNQQDGHVPADGAISSRFWFVRGDKNPDCSPNTSIYYENIEDYGANSMSGREAAYLYEPDKYLNIIFGPLTSSIGYSLIVGNATSLPYGVYMRDKTFKPNHNIDSGWQNDQTPLQYTASILTHEVGHWLGLYHTFKQIPGGANTSGCSWGPVNSDWESAPGYWETGDRVSDTPVDIGAPTLFSCALPGDVCNVDPTIIENTNWMSYRFPRCNFGVFTQEQSERSHEYAQSINFISSIIQNGEDCYIPPDFGPGCMDATACNYSPFASTDDGSCQYFDAAYVCGGDCDTNIDEDAYCDNVDNCFDLDACNYDDSNNDACQYLDACGICDGEGPDPECGCTVPVWPMCNCQGGIDWDQDGICDNLIDYPAPEDDITQINPTDCAIPADICLSLDVSGSLNGDLSTNAFNSIATCRSILQWLYPAITDGTVRISIAIWASPAGGSLPESKIVMPLTSYQQAWNISMSLFDYLENDNNPLQLLRDLGDQPLQSGTDEFSAFQASYYALTAQEYYDPSTLKNIIMISDAEFNGACDLNIWNAPDYVLARNISKQIQDGNHISHEKAGSLQDEPWPLIDDQEFTLQDSVPMRIIGIGLGPSSESAITCWESNDWPSMQALCSNNSTFAAFDVDAISAIRDSLLIVCETPEDGCPIEISGHQLEYNAMESTGTLILFGNDPALIQNYSINQFLDDGTYQMVSNLEVTYSEISAGYGTHTFTWEAPDNASTSPISIEVIYEDFGFTCSEFIGLSCDNPTFIDRNLARDIWKGGFGYFDSNQNKVRMIRTSQSSIFIAPINDCNVIGYNDCSACATNCNVSAIQVPNNNFNLAERISASNIFSAPDQNYIDLGLSLLEYSANLEVIEIDISTYLEDIETQGYGIFMFPKAGLDYPDIGPGNWPDVYDSEFEALFKEYFPYSGNGINDNNPDDVIFGRATDEINTLKSQCMFAYLIDDCEDISENIHAVRFDYHADYLGTGTTASTTLNQLGWPTNEEIFLLYEGYQRPKIGNSTSEKSFFKEQVYDPFMLNYEGVTCHVDNQTFYVKRALNPLSSSFSSNSTYLQDIAADLNVSLSPSDTYKEVSDRYPVSGGTNLLESYIESQINSNYTGLSPTKDFPVSTYYADGLAAYIDDNNIPLSEVEIRFPNGCSVYPQDEPEIGPCLNEASLTYLGANYNLLEIGNRCWFDRELKNIEPLIVGAPQYSSSTDPVAWQQANQSEDPRWTHPTEAEDAYWNQGWYTGPGPANIINDQHLGGALYNWWVVDAGNICPAGYHVSTNSDWNDLEKTVFGARSNKISGQSNAINFVDQQTIQSLIDVGFLDNINLAYPNSPDELPSNFGGRLIEGITDTQDGLNMLSSSIAEVGLMGGIRVGVDGTFRESRTARYWWVAEDYPNKPLEFNRQKAAWSRGIKIVPDANDPSFWDDSGDGLSRYRDLWSTSQNKGNGLFIRCVKDL